MLIDCCYNVNKSSSIYELRFKKCTTKFNTLRASYVALMQFDDQILTVFTGVKSLHGYWVGNDIV